MARATCQADFSAAGSRAPESRLLLRRLPEAAGGRKARCLDGR